MTSHRFFKMAARRSYSTSDFVFGDFAQLGKSKSVEYLGFFLGAFLSIASTSLLLPPSLPFFPTFLSLSFLPLSFRFPPHSRALPLPSFKSSSP